MSKITITQGGVTASVSQISYHGAEGFREDNTWHVVEENIHAEIYTKLVSGPAEIRYDGKIFHVTIEVIQWDKQLDDDDESEDVEPVCEIEIEYENLPKLAHALGLLSHYSKKQLAALGIV